MADAIEMYKSIARDVFVAILVLFVRYRAAVTIVHIKREIDVGVRLIIKTVPRYLC